MAPIELAEEFRLQWRCKNAHDCLRDQDTPVHREYDHILAYGLEKRTNLPPSEAGLDSRTDRRAGNGYQVEARQPALDHAPGADRLGVGPASVALAPHGTAAADGFGGSDVPECIHRVVGLDQVPETSSVPDRQASELVDIARRINAVAVDAHDKPAIQWINFIGHYLRSVPTWCANTTGHSQAMAWLTVGRRARADLGAGRVVFSPAGEPLVPGSEAEVRTRAPLIMDGITALDSVLRRAGYDSVAAAVAEHTVFLRPKTVEQTGGRPVFPVVRDMTRRGKLGNLPDGRPILFVLSQEIGRVGVCRKPIP
jgi:hypothetical protein